MTRQTRISFAIYAGAAVLACALIYHRAVAPIACGSDEAVRRVQATLSPGQVVENMRRIGLDPFGTRVNCAADIRDFGANGWRPVTYTITRPRRMGPSMISAELGDATQTEPKAVSWWQRLLAQE